MAALVRTLSLVLKHRIQEAYVASIGQELESHRGKSVLLVEPDDLIRRSLVNRLRSAMPGCCVTGNASVAEALALHSSEAPSLAVVDIADPDTDGVDTIRSIKGAMPNAQLVALTMSDHAEYCDTLARAGASASVLIWQSNDHLLPVIKRLLDDEGAQDDGAQPD